MSSSIAVGVLAAAVLLVAYTYFGYPLLLRLVGSTSPKSIPTPTDTEDWPHISFSVPAYNEEAQIDELIKSLLALDYPRDRVEILVVSDASDDRTDEIVRGYADQGVRLLRMPERGGKNKAENAAAHELSSDIIVNTDASIRIAPDALKPLIAVFADPAIGCASGRDVSVGSDDDIANAGESGYVGYEMKIRDMETKVSGIVGASGCFYAIRSHLHRLPLPEQYSRDFSAALHAKEHGYRPVSVTDAVCYVPRTTSLRKEYRRKVRTITRGMQTLWHKRHLMNPIRHGWFAWMLFSHKVCRWALPWAAAAAGLALVALAVDGALWAQAVVAGGIILLILAWIGWLRAEAPSVGKIFSVPAYLVAGNVAAMHAFLRAISGGKDALWEPTRREVVKAG